MGTIDRRLTLLERRRPPGLSPERRAARPALRRLSVQTLEDLESALVSREAGLPLDAAQEAAIAAWERASEEGEPPWAS